MTYSLYLVPSIQDDWEATWYALTAAEDAGGHYPDRIPEDAARRMAEHGSVYYRGRLVWHINALVRSADSKSVFYPHNPIK